MIKFLLDTNICSDIINNPNGKVANRLFHEGEHHASINWVVKAELRFGATKKGSAELQRRVDALINELAHTVFEEHSIINQYIAIRHDLTQRGELIGQNDLWIASHAVAQNLTLVTHNTKEFSRVQGLKVVDWFL